MDTTLQLAIEKALIMMPVLILSLSVHEAAHAYAAFRYGDNTARDLGRITLNPVAHVDPIGTILIPLISLFSLGFVMAGWAKPVPIIPRNLRNFRTAFSVIAVAGPLSNVALSFVFFVLYTIVLITGIYSLGGVGTFILSLFSYGIIINIGLAIFNMIPIPPLDGSKVLAYVLPHNVAERYLSIGGYGFFIVVLLLNIPAFSSALQWLMSFFAAPYFIMAHQLQDLVA